MCGACSSCLCLKTVGPVQHVVPHIVHYSLEGKGNVLSLQGAPAAILTPAKKQINNIGIFFRVKFNAAASLWSPFFTYIHML